MSDLPLGCKSVQRQAARIVPQRLCLNSSLFRTSQPYVHHRCPSDSSVAAHSGLTAGFPNQQCRRVRVPAEIAGLFAGITMQ